MSNNALKFLFLFVIIGVVLFSRAAYPNFSILPSLSANEAETVPSSSNPGILALPTIATDMQASVSAVSGSQASETVSNAAEGGSTPAFSKIADTATPQLDDAAVLVADLQSGAPLLSLNAGARWPMASLTKLMTAAIVFDNLPIDQKITITPAMFAVDPQEYTLTVGGTYTVSDLLRILLLPSSNVAAEALANTYGRTQFLALMNAKAEQWGMADTYYDDPSGISSANESTAHDLLLLTQKIDQQYPQIFAITRTPHVVVVNLTTSGKVAVNSIDNFSGTANFIGGKTGHTNEASGNLLTVFNYGGHPLFILVLGTNDRFGDSTKLYNWVKANYR